MEGLKIRYGNFRKFGNGRVEEIELKNISHGDMSKLMVFLNGIKGFSCEVVQRDDEYQSTGLLKKDNRIIGVGC